MSPGWVVIVFARGSLHRILSSISMAFRNMGWPVLLQLRPQMIHAGSDGTNMAIILRNCAAICLNLHPMMMAAIYLTI